MHELELDPLLQTGEQRRPMARQNRLHEELVLVDQPQIRQGPLEVEMRPQYRARIRTLDHSDRENRGGAELTLRQGRQPEVVSAGKPRSPDCEATIQGYDTAG